MKKQNKHKILLTASVASAVALTSQLSLAQAVTTVDVAKTGDRAPPVALEEVVVTGTSIRGIAPMGAEPVVYGRADIEADSPVDIRDALSNVPQISNFGTDADQSTSNRFRTAGYQPIIHNLGIYATLTLFNGHRMADVGGEAVFPDPSILPTIAIQRVDVIADGASAIYGSDAVAGVVNFVYRRGVEGFEASMTEGIDPKTTWSNRNVGALWGHKFDRGEVMVAYEYSKADRPKVQEFPFIAEANHTSFGGIDQRSTNCEYSTVRFRTTTYYGPNLTPTVYRCNPNGGTDLAQDGERHTALVTGRYNLTDAVELWSELNFSDYKSYSVAGWGNGGRWQFNLLSSSPFFVVPAGANPAGITSELVRGDGVGIFGYRTRNANSTVQGGTFGANIDIGHEWQTSVMVHRSRTFDYIDDPGLDLQNVGTLANSGIFNPFSLTANSDAVKARINNGFTQLNDASQTLTELSVKADGPVFAVPAGNVMAAIGVGQRTQHLQQLQSGGCPKCSFYQIVRNDDIERGVVSVFGEMVVPLVSDLNAKPGIKKLSLSFAGRYDDYDGLDAQFNPKFGIDWSITDSIRVHGTAGKSYVAPNIGLITSIFGVPQPAITAAVNGVNYNFDIYNLGGGNPALEPEKAKSYTFGVNWAPEFIDGLKMGVNYYHVKYSNLIYKPTRADVLTNAAFVNSRVLGTFDAATKTYLPFSAAYVAQLIASAPPQTPITPGQTFNMAFNSFAINLGTRVHAGYDVDVGYDVDTRFGKLGLGVVANKQTKYDEEVVPGSGYFSRIATGDAPAWATRFHAQWQPPGIPLRVGLVSNYKSGYSDPAPVGKVSSYLTHNLTVAYDFEKVLNGLTLQARVRNLTDKRPPFYEIDEGYDDDQHTPYGRQFDLTFRVKF